jgi:lysophospholipase L1-like esterase
MKSHVRRGLCSVAALFAAVLIFPAPAGADDSSAVHYYVSLGDSLAQSFQPPSDFSHGYAEQLYATLKAQDPTLQLVKLGCGGETTESMIRPYLPFEGRGARFFCNYPHGSQLAEAINFLAAHRQFVRLVTIDIGANDNFQFGADGPAVIAANLPGILASLREAAGPDVPIVGMNYYDPFLAVVWFETHSLAALQAEVASIVAFNNLLEGIYHDAGDPVADVESAFSVTNTALVGGVPFNVIRECQWTWICDVGNIHANTAGYGVIAQAFQAAVP